MYRLTATIISPERIDHPSKAGLPIKHLLAYQKLKFFISHKFPKDQAQPENVNPNESLIAGWVGGSILKNI